MRRARILVGLALVSCGKPASKAAAPDAAPAVTEPRLDAAPPPPRRVVAPISVEEVAAVIPAPIGAIVLAPARKPSIGERVEARYCVGSASVPESAQALQQQLAAAEWGNVVTRPRGATGALAVTAQKGELALVATLDRGSDPRCRGRTQVVVELHKLTVVPGTASPAEPASSAPAQAPAGSEAGQAAGRPLPAR